MLAIGLAWLTGIGFVVFDASQEAVSPIRLLVALAGATMFTVGGAWMLFMPLVRLQDAQLRVRRNMPWPVEHEVDAVDVDWRVGRDLIGPSLRAVDVEGRRVHIPVWALRRADAERLFDWLDDVVPVREPVASPPPPEARR
jgi:hypothetical protein